MPIAGTHDNTGHVDYHERLQLFVDRHTSVRIFLEALHTRPLGEEILFFHGVGGAGKSLLLRYLRQECCKLLDPELWRAKAALPDDAEFRLEFAEARGTRLTCVLHDFSTNNAGHDRPRDPLEALLMLRRNLGAAGFAFPTFDFAVLLYSHRTGQPAEKAAGLLPVGERPLALDVLRVLVEGSLTGQIATTVAGRFSADLERRGQLWWSGRRLTDEALAGLLRKEAEIELIPCLPVLLAEDLNAQLTRPSTPPLVLMFDTHDAFWSEQSFAGNPTVYFERDEWLRTLLRHVELTRVLVVVTGRDRPLWSEPGIRMRIPDEYVRTVAVADLSADDARLYLRQRGLVDDSLQSQALAQLSTEDGVHPLFLGLAADLLVHNQAQDNPTAVPDLLAGARGADGSPASAVLLHRLLRYLSRHERRAIEAVAAARTFDQELFDLLGDSLGFEHDEDAFSDLIRFSFVLPAQRAGSGRRYKVHSLLRRVLATDRSPALVQAHVQLAAHYVGRSTSSGDAAHLEALLHAGSVPETRADAADQWLALLDQIRDDADSPALTRALEITDEMAVQGWAAELTVTLAQAAHIGTNARYADAAALIETALRGTPALVEPGQRLLHAEALLQLAWCHRWLTRLDEAEQVFREGLDVSSGGEASAAHMTGRLCFGLAGVAEDRCEDDVAANWYRRAIEAYEQALAGAGEIPPVRWLSDVVSSYSGSSCILRAAGDRSAAHRLAETGTARARAALALEPEDRRSRINLEQVLAATAEAHDDHRSALLAAQESLEICRWLSADGAPDPRLLRRLLLMSRLERRARPASSDAYLQEAVDAARRLTDFRPSSRHGWFGLGEALLEQAERRPAERRRLAEQASQALERALEVAPRLVPAQRLLQDSRRLAGLGTGAGETATPS
jgi:tetratricopeptide (TPR) repeat protein